jgi:NDP-sugar pyrophosphorylase family protein
VPFGVISETDGMIREIVEKPVHTFKVNAGVYFLNPCVLPLVPANSFYDLPDLFNTCVSAGMHTAAHSVTGYWIDIGQVADYERAQREYDEAFR